MCNKENKLSAKERYEITINARNTNYDNFNKWATYFSVIIGAIFVSYYELSKENNGNKFIIEVSLLCLLGYISSFLWYLSCRGFYFWNKIYIELLKEQQKEMKIEGEEKLYGDLSESSTYWPHEELDVSTPTIAILLSFIITIAWGILLIIQLKNLYESCKLNINIFCYYFLSIMVILIITKNLYSCSKRKDNK